MRACSAEMGAGAEPVLPVQECAFCSDPSQEILHLLNGSNKISQRSFRDDHVGKNEPPGKGKGPTLQMFPVEKTQQHKLNLYQTLENPHMRDLSLYSSKA